MSQSNRTALIAFLLAVAVGITACAGDPNRRAKIGGGVGAVLGGLIGSQVGGDDDALRNAAIGAAVGALAGGGVGHYMDLQQQELERRLKAERAQNTLNIRRLPSGALKIGIASDATFALDKSTLSQHAQRIFGQIAATLKDYNKTAVHIIGYTDSTGSEQYNLQLSRERALSVANFLVRHGVNSQRVLTWAAGESHPITSNETKAGRARNRRVEIVIKPIVKGREKQAFSAPPPIG